MELVKDRVYRIVNAAKSIREVNADVIEGEHVILTGVGGGKHFEAHAHVEVFISRRGCSQWVLGECLAEVETQPRTDLPEAPPAPEVKLIDPLRAQLAGLILAHSIGPDCTDPTPHWQDGLTRGEFFSRSAVQYADALIAELQK